MASPALYEACKKNQYDLALNLIEVENADVHWFSESCLRIACFYGHENIVDLLISKGADVSFNKNMCLESAIRQGRLKIVQKLVEAGVDIHLSGESALRMACNIGDLKIVEYLVEKGADIQSDDSIALVQAYQAGAYRVARFLIYNGANPNAHEGKCISILAKQGLLLEAKFLFLHKADIKLATQAVRIASLKGFTQFVWYLLSLGADKEGLTPFHLERYEREQEQRRNEAAKKIYFWIIPKLYAPGSASAYRLGMKGYEASMKGQLA